MSTNPRSNQFDGQRYLTFADLRAKLGGRARSTIYLDLETGRLPKPIKLGGRLYWCEQAIDACLLGYSENGAGE